MTCLTDWRFVAPLLAVLGIGGAVETHASPASPLKTRMVDNAMKSATAGLFASSAEAEAFLTRVLPAATVANLKYRSPGSDAETRWLTKTITFQTNRNGGVVASMHESMDQYSGGVLTSQGTHDATFAIDDVKISEEIGDDVAENGERARGVMFRCVGSPCIQAVWGGEKSVSASTDIFIQDATQRGQILVAFQALQRKTDSQ